MTFLYYFLLNELNKIDSDEILSESTDLYLSKKEVEKSTKHIKSNLVSYFSEKFPKIQHEDIEEAFSEAITKLDKKIKNCSELKSKLKKLINKELVNVSNNKKQIKKNLSCVKIIKKSIHKDQDTESVSKLIKRAERMLTSQEKKILHLCCQGKSVRTIGQELKTSAPTAWRILNSAIDKIRLSYGFKSRHKDIR